MQCGPLVYPCRIWYMKVLFLRETKLLLHKFNRLTEGFDLCIYDLCIDHNSLS